MPDGSTPGLNPTGPRFRLAVVCVHNIWTFFCFSSLTSTLQLLVNHSGGGIAGLTLAVALGRYGESNSPIQIDLYESGPEITTVGAGISVWARTWAIMRALGLYEELANEAVTQTERRREAGGEEEFRESRDPPCRS